MANHIGKCTICGETKKLTFEHIPPQSANNKSPVKILTGDSFIEMVTDEDRLPWDKDKLKYVQSQKGIGDYTLCESCNNLTGAYYGQEYVGFANETIRYFLNNKDEVKNGKVFIAKVKLYPLRFIKQVISMFCSTTIGLIDCHPEFKDLLLDKNKTLENPDFKISMYYLKNSDGYGRFSPIAMGSLSGNIRTVSCLDLYPFGFVFDYDKNFKDDRLMDITGFLSYKYDEQRTISICAPIYERNMPFPLDFRTKEEYLKEKNK